jgi:translation elongation factor P/translation initiation factor 5A
MKKSFFTLAIILTLSGSIMFTSCIGSFGLSNRLLSWNKSLGNKFINEVVFFAFLIVPVYEITLFADAVVLNSIEFWTGENPVQVSIKKIKGEKGDYTVETTKNGYNINNDKGQKLSLIYDKDTNVWSAVVGDYATKLLKIEGENAIVFMPNGEEKSIELNEKGLLAFRQELQNTMFFAAK